jgi:hypothetical protein
VLACYIQDRETVADFFPFACPFEWITATGLFPLVLMCMVAVLARVVMVVSRSCMRVGMCVLMAMGMTVS